MCGIAGILSLSSDRRVKNHYLEAINRHMVCRGPDDSGFWYSQCHRVGFAHNRLAIIDPHERANQPMEFLHGRYVMTYNGEIYNYKSLKEQLIKKGYVFHTNSDAEVVMAMYDCFDSQMLDQLRGMYAFAIWDTQQEKLFAARDPFGIKPFYYADLNNEFIFSSSVKSIAAIPELQLTQSAAGWCGFLTQGSVPEPFTIYEQIKALPAGHYLQIGKNGRVKLSAYFSIYDDYAKHELTDNAPIDYELMADSLSESVSQHLVADVPVGLFLSSGIDSNVIAFYARKHPDLVGFTLDFEEFGEQNNESRLATQSAKHLGIQHQVLKLNLYHSQEFIESFFSSMDQPSIDGLNVWMISQAVSQHGFKAVLSGLGGDEVFAGYPSFNDVPKFDSVITMLNKFKLTSLPVEKLSAMVTNLAHPKFSGFMTPTRDSFLHAYKLKRDLYLNQDLGLFFDSEFISNGIEELATNAEKTVRQLEAISNPYLKVSALEIDNYMKNQLLRDADWASMSHSLELRVPFVDRKLINICANQIVKIKPPKKCRIMKNIMTNSLPESIFTKEKTGFETPVKKWLESNPQLQSWKSQSHMQDSQTPWARRWAYEVKTRFLN